MAHVNTIWVNSTDMENKRMTVKVKLKPAGEVYLDVNIPRNFYEAIYQIAQTAADAHEAQMKAEILGETPTPPKETQPTEK